jgi:hypothetical protein
MTQQPWGGQPAQQYPPQQAQPQGWQQPAQPQSWPAQQPTPAQNPWGGAPQQQAPAQEAGPAIEHGEAFDDFFSGSGEKIPGFDFGATQNGGEKVVGSSIVGEILEMAKMAQRDYADNGKILYWEPRNETEQRRPRMQLAITLQTDLRNWQGVKPKLIPVDPATQQPKPPTADDGKRRIYVKEFSDLNRAINQACATAGQKPRIGGKLAVIVRGFEPTQKGNDKVLYDAQYLPAPEKVATDGFFTQQAPPAAPPQQAFTAPVVSTATGQPVVHQQQVPAPQDGQVYAANPYAGVPAQPNGAPEGWQPQQAPQDAPAAAVASWQQQAPQAPQGGPVPGTFPAQAGQAAPPAGPPEWAQPQGQGYAPPQQTQAAPQYDAPPY